MRRLSIVSLVGAIALGSSSVAAPAPPPVRIALLFGNSDYNMNGQIDSAPMGRFERDLPHTCQRVAAIKPKLAAAGFTVLDYCNLTHQQFEAAVDALKTKYPSMPRGSVVFVYYAGHGSQFYGNPFLLPVMFQEESGPDAASEKARLRYYRLNADELSYLFERLPGDPGVVAVVSLDNCRDDPTGDNGIYNNAVTIRSPNNAIVQYATSSGDTAPDDDSYATALVAELDARRDVRDIMARVNSRIYRQYMDGRRATIADTYPGAGITSLKPTPLGLPGGALPDGPNWTLTPSPTMAGPGAPGEATFRREGTPGTKLDIFWCGGGPERQRYTYAKALAERIAARADEFGIGRLRIRFLSENKNFHQGFNVRNNLMRYDPKQPAERALLMKLSAAYPDGNFLPQPGKGHGGRDTAGYVSAFVCSATISG